MVKKSAKNSRYLMVSTPGLPTGHFLMTENEVKSLQERTRKRRKK